MHVMCNDDPGDHIDNVVRADGCHHEPLVAQDEEHEIVHFEPVACPVLQGHNEAGADVPRIEEVVGIMIHHYKGLDAGVSEEEAWQPLHEEVFLLMVYFFLMYLPKR